MPRQPKPFSRRMTTLALTLGALLLSTGTAPSMARADSEYEIDVANGRAAVGESGTITVTVTAGEGFKANKEYPNKVKDLASSGATRRSTSVKGTVSGNKISYSISATPNSAGTHEVSGEVRFSVCNESSCHIKKVPLSATITGT